MKSIKKNAKKKCKKKIEKEMYCFIEYYNKKKQIMSQQMNSITTLCTYCGKCFKRKAMFNRHELLCSLYYTTLHTDENDTKYDTKPVTVSHMYKMLQEMTRKQYHLEERIKIWEKRYPKRKRDDDEITIIQSLPFSKTNTLQTLGTQFIVNQDDIFYLFHNTFLDTLLTIIHRNMIQFISSSSNETNPFYYFKDTEKLYVADDHEQKWIPFKACESILSSFLSILHKKILEQLLQWRQMNKPSKTTTDIELKYNTCLVQFMDSRFVNMTSQPLLQNVKDTIHTMISKI